MSKKLKLVLEELSVESFQLPRSPGSDRGTVRANSETGDPQYNSYDICPYTEPGSDSYGEATCGFTCSLECQDGGYRTFSGNWERNDQWMC